jgi:hypothetical protein
MTVVQAPDAPSAGAYPVQLSLTDQRDINRLWGIPFLGVFVRMILAIPHLIILGIMGIGMYLYFFLGWIPVLLLGRQPGFVVSFLTEYMRRSFRIAGYAVFLLPGGYPPLGPGNPNPVDLRIDVQDRSLSRLWGIPGLGILVRFLVLIPHFVVLSVLGLITYASLAVLWIPILVTGKYPGIFASFYRGLFLYGSRVQAYILLLPVPYPPFSFS